MGANDYHSRALPAIAKRTLRAPAASKKQAMVRAIACRSFERMLD
jgi:hypothetical protein